MSEPCGLTLSRRALPILFARLVEIGCDPRWTTDGGIIATCPACREPDALVVEIVRDREDRPS